MKNTTQAGEEASRCGVSIQSAKRGHSGLAETPRQAIKRRYQIAREVREAMIGPLIPNTDMRGWPLIELGNEVHAAELLMDRLGSELIGAGTPNPTVEQVRLAPQVAELVGECRARLRTAFYRTFAYYMQGGRHA